jgi:hypothetical protein
MSASSSLKPAWLDQKKESAFHLLVWAVNEPTVDPVGGVAPLLDERPALSLETGACR